MVLSLDHSKRQEYYVHVWYISPLLAVAIKNAIARSM